MNYRTEIIRLKDTSPCPIYWDNVVNVESSCAGYFDPDRNVIIINGLCPDNNNPVCVINVLVHELQHAKCWENHCKCFEDFYDIGVCQLCEYHAVRAELNYAKQCQDRRARDYSLTHAVKIVKYGSDIYRGFTNEILDYANEIESLYTAKFWGELCDIS